MNGGWICLHRSIRNCGIWKGEAFSRGQAFIDLLLGAYYRDGFAAVHGKRIDVLRGELVTSISELAGRWGWSRGKVLRFLNMLEANESIMFKKNRFCTIIKIINFDCYQAKQAKAAAGAGKTGLYEQWRDPLKKVYGLLDE